MCVFITVITISYTVEPFKRPCSWKWKKKERERSKNTDRQTDRHEERETKRERILIHNQPLIF